MATNVSMVVELSKEGKWILRHGGVAVEFVSALEMLKVLGGLLDDAKNKTGR